MASTIIVSPSRRRIGTFLVKNVTMGREPEPANRAVPVMPFWKIAVRVSFTDGIALDHCDHMRLSGNASIVITANPGPGGVYGEFTS